MKEAVRRLFGPHSKEIELREGRRGVRVRVFLNPDTLGNWFLDEVWELKRFFGRGRVELRWNSSLPGIGNVRLTLTYPHSTSVRILPPGEWPYPHYPANSRSEHETRGKYDIILNHNPPVFHDDVKTSLSISANGSKTYHMTDLDLIMRTGDGQYELVEVINGKTQDPLASIKRKYEAWRALRSLGFPIDRVILYIIPKSVYHFEASVLGRVLDVLEGFRGKIIIARSTYNWKRVVEF